MSARRLAKSHSELGPDPEPLTAERLERVIETMVAQLAFDARASSRRRACPLESAFGRHGPCTGRACLFHRVAGVRAECAVEQWAPHASRDRRLAAWFVARRLDAARAEEPSLPAHELATPAPAISP